MNVNWFLFPTLILSVLLFILGLGIIRRCSSRASKIATVFIGTILALPGLLMPLYYLHVFDTAAWYYEFRSWPFIELSGAGLGFLFGAHVGLAKKPKPVSVALSLPALILLLAIPYAKPILRPLPMSSLRDKWQNGVCLQSTPSSCGAASAASILGSLGIKSTEKELAKECFTYRGGTENWYLARALRRRGCSVQFKIDRDIPKDAHLPLIAGVKVRRFGHFIAILSKKDGIYECADPRVGLERVSEADIRRHFLFTGFVMEVGKVAE